MKVNNYTRAGNFGKEISCPNCESTMWVFHFSWSALMCQCCKSDIKKTEWNLILTVKDLKNEQRRIN